MIADKSVVVAIQNSNGSGLCPNHGLENNPIITPTGMTRDIHPGPGVSSCLRMRRINMVQAREAA